MLNTFAQDDIFILGICPNCVGKLMVTSSIYVIFPRITIYFNSMLDEVGGW